MLPATPAPDEAARVAVWAFRCRNRLFVRCDDLPWLLGYMRQEATGGSVPEPADPDEDDSEEEGEPMRALWCPDGTWKLTVLRGPLKGEVFKSRVQDVDQAKWDKGCAALSVPWGLEGASRAQVKQVLLAYMQGEVRRKMAEAGGAVA